MFLSFFNRFFEGQIGPDIILFFSFYENNIKNKHLPFLKQISIYFAELKYLYFFKSGKSVSELVIPVQLRNFPIVSNSAAGFVRVCAIRCARPCGVRAPLICCNVI